MIHRVEVDGTNLAYREGGEGPLLLLVHGFPLDHTLWSDQLRALGDGRRCLAVDLPGFGGSDPVSPFTMEAVADLLASLVGVLGEERADVVGLSMGGYVTLALWERHPEVVRSLVLADTRAEPDTPEGRERRDEMARETVTRGIGWLADQMGEGLLAPGADLIARARLRSMVERVPYQTVVAALRGMRDRADRIPLLPTIEVPTLVVVGEEDTITPPGASLAMAEAIPGAHLATIPGAGHLPPIERPEASNEALRQFLDQ